MRSRSGKSKKCSQEITLRILASLASRHAGLCGSEGVLSNLIDTTNIAHSKCAVCLGICTLPNPASGESSTSARKLSPQSRLRLEGRILVDTQAHIGLQSFLEKRLLVNLSQGKLIFFGRMRCRSGPENFLFMISKRAWAQRRDIDQCMNSDTMRKFVIRARPWIA